MVKPDSFSARWTQFMNRWAARSSARAKPATGFVSQPEPKTVGSVARARQLRAGNLMFAGHLVEAPGAMIWDVDPPDEAFEEDIHGFSWLDDLAAVGDAPARALAQKWVWGWIARYGRGTGPGWLPELAARRLIRCIHHALFLLRGKEKAESDLFYRSLAQQTIFLSRRWHVTPPGVGRFEAMAGVIYAGLSLEGMSHHVEPALKALCLDCTRQIDAGGGIPTRCPEELLLVFTLLIWTATALDGADQEIPDEIVDAVTRIAPNLRALRHADGGLGRFHGGGRGLEGRLDQTLADSGVRKQVSGKLAMGFARLASGRTSVLIDSAPPPTGDASFNAHASTLAFELTSGRRPLIVNCGSGMVFGEDWRRAGRATPSHTALSLDGLSSARLGKTLYIGSAKRELLDAAPKTVPYELKQDTDGFRYEGGHDGYVGTHGLTVARILELSKDGRTLAGEDMLLALEDDNKRLFDRKFDESNLHGIPFALRFHLHPDVDSAVDLGGAVVSLALRSGEIWVFRPDGDVEMSIEPSVYLEKGRLRPRATKQIVLSGRAMQYATRIRWTLAKAQDTAVAIRDLAQDELDLMT
ncbi:heparinase II/III family protein [Pseudoprimorskyibacter insulae]|uniref:Heparinase II/III-like C-terminal domain-containing protein n=1 Tax=Pseudoprimorskyibacter insulae TaxID=1695997 RepID=A0A2R8AV29_9RHOB|nr:heparinase II/III family protein [Pseudoprimorskyibacter insulae]SPF79893.1 hypothetical protein PRI8871_01694 [Pseudoprimorskyibacter insulae]